MPSSTFMTPQTVAILAMLAWALAPGWLGSVTAPELRNVLRNNLMNNADYDRMEHGYYEQLLSAGRSFTSVTESAAPAHRPTRSEPAPFDAGELALVVGDLREFVLKPNLSIVHNGASWSTNAQGMRDRGYATTKPAQTFRIAMAGDSIGSGWGVNDGAGFEPSLERSLSTRSQRGHGPAVEILNFSVPGHGPGQRWDHFSKVGWPTEPDLVLFEATLADAGWDERRLRGLLPRGVGWDSPLYRDVLNQAGVKPGGTSDDYKRALKPYRWDLTAAIYRTVAADCRSRGIPCVWVLIPRVGKTTEPADLRRLVELAHQARFAAVVDLSDAYQGMDPTQLAIGPNDFHPNADGHALLARRLDDALSGLPEMRRLFAATDNGGSAR